MSPLELKRCRKTLGLSQSGLARLLRLSEDNGDRTVRRWEAGEIEVTGPVSLVLDMLCNDFDPVSVFNEYDRAQIAAARAESQRMNGR